VSARAAALSLFFAVLRADRGWRGVRFPLYSKGVDAYRFEYAVFLLNKDIEMARRKIFSD
jgi:hypothetical protein